MIPINANIQIQGLGRCFAHTVDNNRIYLRCPTTKTIHVYDVRHGILGELMDGYTTLCGVFAKHEEGKTTFMSWKPGEGFKNPARMQGEWSEELATLSFPTVCSTIVNLILEPRTEADQVEKAMAEYVKIKVSKYKSDGSYRFHFGDKEHDLEWCLHKITEQFYSSLKLHYTWSHVDILDADDQYIRRLFSPRVEYEGLPCGEAGFCIS